MMLVILLIAGEGKLRIFAITFRPELAKLTHR